MYPFRKGTRLACVASSVVEGEKTGKREGLVREGEALSHYPSLYSSSFLLFQPSAPNTPAKVGGKRRARQMQARLR